VPKIMKIGYGLSKMCWKYRTLFFRTWCICAYRVVQKVSFISLFAIFEILVLLLHKAAQLKAYTKRQK